MRSSTGIRRYHTEIRVSSIFYIFEMSTFAVRACAVKLTLISMRLLMWFSQSRMVRFTFSNNLNWPFFRFQKLARLNFIDIFSINYDFIPIFQRIKCVCNFMVIVTFIFCLHKTIGQIIFDFKNSPGQPSKVYWKSLEKYDLFSIFRKINNVKCVGG